MKKMILFTISIFMLLAALTLLACDKNNTDPYSMQLEPPSNIRIVNSRYIYVETDENCSGIKIYIRIPHSSHFEYVSGASKATPLHLLNLSMGENILRVVSVGGNQAYVDSRLVTFVNSKAAYFPINVSSIISNNSPQNYNFVIGRNGIFLDHTPSFFPTVILRRAEETEFKQITLNPNPNSLAGVSWYKRFCSLSLRVGINVFEVFNQPQAILSAGGVLREYFKSIPSVHMINISAIHNLETQAIDYFEFAPNELILRRGGNANTANTRTYLRRAGHYNFVPIFNQTSSIMLLEIGPNVGLNTLRAVSLELSVLVGSVLTIFEYSQAVYFDFEVKGTEQRPLIPVYDMRWYNMDIGIFGNTIIMYSGDPSAYHVRVYRRLPHQTSFSFFTTGSPQIGTARGFFSFNENLPFGKTEFRLISRSNSAMRVIDGVWILFLNSVPAYINFTIIDQPQVLDKPTDVRFVTGTGGLLTWLTPANSLYARLYIWCDSSSRWASRKISPGPLVEGFDLQLAEGKNRARLISSGGLQIYIGDGIVINTKDSPPLYFYLYLETDGNILVWKYL